MKKTLPYHIEAYALGPLGRTSGTMAGFKPPLKYLLPLLLFIFSAAPGSIAQSSDEDVIAHVDWQNVYNNVTLLVQACTSFYVEETTVQRAIKSHNQSSTLMIGVVKIASDSIDEMLLETVFPSKVC